MKTFFFFMAVYNMALAGRPVFKMTTTDELIARADTIAVVSLYEKIPTEADGCKPRLLKFKIHEVLKQKQNLKYSKDNVYQVVTNRTGLRDCEFRKNTHGKSGVSFSAERYIGLNDWELNVGDKFIIFLSHLDPSKDKVFQTQLVMDGAYENLQKYDAIKALLQFKN